MANTDTLQNELLVKTDELPWIAIADEIDFRLLRTCEITGTWTVYFRAAAGASFPRHQHYGAGEYMVTKGKMVYRAGEAGTGDYGYEPLGAIHDQTSFLEYTELYFTNIYDAIIIGLAAVICCLLVIAKDSKFKRWIEYLVLTISLSIAFLVCISPLVSLLLFWTIITWICPTGEPGCYTQ